MRISHEKTPCLVAQHILSRQRNAMLLPTSVALGSVEKPNASTTILLPSVFAHQAVAGFGVLSFLKTWMVSIETSWPSI